MKPPSKNKKNKFSESFQVEEAECLHVPLCWAPNSMRTERSSFVWKLILCISRSFFFKVFFFNGPFLKSLLNVLQYCVCFVLFFWPGTMWDLNSPPGIEPSPPALEGEVLTTGPPGKFPLCISSSGY